MTKSDRIWRIEFLHWISDFVIVCAAQNNELRFFSRWWNTLVLHIEIFVQIQNAVFELFKKGLHVACDPNIRSQ
jgi:hypothetical protein